MVQCLFKCSMGCWISILEKLVTAVVFSVPDARAIWSSRHPARHRECSESSLACCSNDSPSCLTWSPRKSFKACHSFFILVKPFEMDEKNPLHNQGRWARLHRQRWQHPGTTGPTAGLGALGTLKAIGFPYELLLFWRSPTFRT